MNTIKQKYTEPMTFVAEVEMEGFMADSTQCMPMKFELDRWVNKGTEEISLDEGVYLD